MSENSSNIFSNINTIRKYIFSDETLNMIYHTANENLGSDPGHDIHHCVRVALLAGNLAKGEVAARDIIAAALLHDIVNLPKDHAEAKNASELSAQVAIKTLPKLGFTEESTKEIGDAIRDHSFSRGATPETLLGKVIQDADRIESLGVLGIFRTISTGTQMGSDFFDANDPWAAERDLNDKKYMIDHFFTKIRHIPEKMNTPEGQAIAYKRLEFMMSILIALSGEIGIKWNPKPAEDSTDKPELDMAS